MDYQFLCMVVLVSLSCVYAAQALMPASWRVRVIRALAKGPLPEQMKHRLAAAAQKASGCACDGCDRTVTEGPDEAKTAAPKEAKIVFIRRPRA